MDTLKAIFFSLFILITGCGNMKSLPKVSHIHSMCITPYKNSKFKTCQSHVVLINDKPVIIPQGFTTDLASIPRILWPIVSPLRSSTVTPSILHDWLYYNPDGRSRQIVDDIYYASLLANGLSKGSAYRYYAAVRLFGWRYFNKKGNK